MDKIIESFLKDFSEDFGLNNLELSKRFEHFINYCLISKIDQDRSILEKINVGGKQNPGIDGLAIIVNDRIVTTKEEIDFFSKTFERLDVEFIFIQSKVSKKFEASDISFFILSIKDFFSEANLNFEDEILNLKDVKDYIYENSIKMSNSPSLKLYYATCGEWKDDNNLKAVFESGIKELKATSLFRDLSFIPIDAEKIKNLYREIKHKITKEINFEKHTILPMIDDVTESYIGYIPAKQLLTLITDNEGELLKSIFYDNVRDFQGFNNVNTGIKNTIDKADLNDKFALLNNGITVVARNINKVGSAFKINDYQIVNGCQTSHVIYHLKDKLTDKIHVPLKLIVTQNPEVTNLITKATNQQTEVKNEAFEILAPFHKKLEDFYLSFEKEENKRVYYERRSKQYDDIEIKRRSKQYDDIEINRTHIITLSTQISSFISMFLNEPHSTGRYYGELLRAYKSRLFQEKHSLFPYYTSGLAFHIIENLYRNEILNIAYKRFKFHLLMLFRVKIAGENIPILSNDKKIENYCNKILENLWDREKAKENFRELEQKLIQQLKITKFLPRQAHLLRAFTEELIPSLKNEKQNGKLVYFNKSKGYGFIRPINSQGREEDIFVHISEINKSIERELNIGEEIKFNIFVSSDGKQANNIEILK